MKGVGAGKKPVSQKAGRRFPVPYTEFRYNKQKLTISRLAFTWIFSTLRLNPSAPSWWPLGPGSGYGALSTFWKVTAMTTRARMLVYHKETTQ